MPIPKIKPYRMPSPSELPASRASWRLDPRHVALLVHDMQGYFLDAFAEGESPVVELLGNIASLLERCEESGVPVYYSAQPGAQNALERGLLWDFWGPGIGATAEATRIHPDVAPRAGAKLVRKHRYSALHRTPLLEELQSSGRTQLVICGVYAHIGCLATALEAFMHDIQPFVVGDAVADFSAADHAMALGYAAQRCAVVTSTREVASALDRTAVLRRSAS